MAKRKKKLDFIKLSKLRKLNQFPKQSFMIFLDKLLAEKN